MKKLIDQKKHFKMYKSGKTWVVAGIAAVSLLIGSMQVVHADETSVDSQKTIVSASLQPKSTDAESSITVKNAEATSQADAVSVDQTTDTKNNVADGSGSQDKTLTDSAEMTNESTTITGIEDQTVESKINDDSQSVGQKK
jgi:lysozyme